MKIVVAGSRGQVGSSLLCLQGRHGVELVGYSSAEMDIRSASTVKKVLAKEQPAIVINAAAFTAVDKAEECPEKAYMVNDTGTAVLAAACAARDIAFFHLSTDYVFDGQKGMYLEEDPTNPQSAYGASKLAGEISARKNCAKTLLLRTSWVFSEYGNNFLKTMLRLARSRDELGLVADQQGGPTAAGHIAAALLQLAVKYRQNELTFGTYHFCGRPYSTWYDFARFIFTEAQEAGLLTKSPSVNALKTEEYPVAAKRPPDSRLDCAKIHKLIPDLANNWAPEVKRIITVLKQEELT